MENRRNKMSHINAGGVSQVFQGIDDDMIDIDDRMNFLQ